jgi:excinuclease ABC subunit A
MAKPEVERIEGLSPAIAIEQRSAGANPRSTVATTTEIYDYLRLLYAHAGIPHCHKCGREVRPQSVEAIRNKLVAVPAGKRMMILSPRVEGRKAYARGQILVGGSVAVEGTGLFVHIPTFFGEHDQFPGPRA